ncbi:hypothetical protein BDR04DRAFT_1108550 [Suillus decipiens]|nr:hypothetical protein BDR04DRAFT_1108550 [Suillus decipiens]
MSFLSMIYTSIIDGILKGMDEKKIEYPSNFIFFFGIVWHVLIEIALLVSLTIMVWVWHGGASMGLKIVWLVLFDIIFYPIRI